MAKGKGLAAGPSSAPRVCVTRGESPPVSGPRCSLLKQAAVGSAQPWGPSGLTVGDFQPPPAVTFRKVAWAGAGPHRALSLAHTKRASQAPSTRPENRARKGLAGSRPP